MVLSAGEKIKVILKRRGMTLGDLAEKLGISRQNLSNKMSRDNFAEQDLTEIAKVLGCSINIDFVFEDTGEKI